MKLASNLEMDAVDYANQGNSFIGLRGSGKTYGAMKAAEQLLNAGIPIVAIDPTGVWPYLRIESDGKEIKQAYNILVIGGERGDLPWPATHPEVFAAAVIRECLNTGSSVIFDLKDKNTSTKASWARIILEVVTILLEENGQTDILRHVFLEEAAEFLPQKVYPGGQMLYSKLESMARMGRNFGLGYTLINQRAEEIAKAIFEICEQVFVFRQAGKNSLTSIQKWLDNRGIDEKSLKLSDLPKMENGECWVINETGEKKIKILPKRTIHPDPKNKVRYSITNSIEGGNLQDLIESLSQQIEQEKPANKGKNVDDPHVPNKNAFINLQKELKFSEDTRKELHESIKMLVDENQKLRAIINAVKSSVDTISAVPIIENTITVNSEMLKDLPRGARLLAENSTYGSGVNKPSMRGMPPDQPIPDHMLPYESGLVGKTGPNTQRDGASMRMLKAAAMFPKGITKVRMCIIAGVKPTSSTCRGALAWMRKEEMITEGPGAIFISQKGIQLCGKVEKPKDLVSFWREILGPQGSTGRALNAINKVYPNTITRLQLAGMIGVTDTSSTMRGVLANLRKNKLIEESGRNIKLSDELK